MKRKRSLWEKMKLWYQDLFMWDKLGRPDDWAKHYYDEDY